MLFLCHLLPSPSSFLFILFSLFYSTAVISTIISSRSHFHSSASVILLLIPGSVFFILVVVLLISVCLFFSSSRSLLNTSYIFSICASILFLRSWIIFTIIVLKSFSGRLPIFSSFSCSCRFLSCCLVCNLFHLILSNLLLFCLTYSQTERSWFLLLLVSAPWWVRLVQKLVLLFP